ncbi:unnamed protein product [Caenorhabditis bovis]|uniref:EGF-like domain-containing protein n=1 Tax=Caenorhabditis bovis TaxID=2654633 RepID=A0A8S1EVP1_9PELO|nr:unnamed protein product [Caenorhabditis bovis]
MLRILWATLIENPPPPLPHPSECDQSPPPTVEMFQKQRASSSHGPPHLHLQQGPPPAWQPPRPPGHEHDYTNDYEDPEEMAKNAHANLLMNTTPSSNYNSYEMSLSQQRRSQQQQQQNAIAPPMLDSWNIEGGGVLHKNADGAYYIPSGSLRTTSSTLSPASGTRYLDQPTSAAPAPAPNTAYSSDASATLLKYPLTGTQPNRRRQVATMTPGDTGKKKKKKLEEENGCCKSGPSKCTLLLAAALMFAIIVILFMLFKSPSYVYTEPLPDAQDPSASSRYSELGIRALPPAISLGERIDVEFYPRHMATTELLISRPSRIVFNTTIGSGAQLVLLIRAGVPPSLSLHDALFPIRADRIYDAKTPSHIVEEVGRARRSVGVEILSPRSATFEQFMLEGRHFLTFINERNRVEPISFVADQLVAATKSPRPAKPGEHPLAPLLTCEANCNNRGECVKGKCRCANGYTGNACEEAICPVVCNGNGVFSGGSCICKSGFKGKECEMRANWCEVADCNGRGKCDTEGRCQCNSGWTGEACEMKACAHPTCHDHGVCVNGTCYCADGWRGKDCYQFADAVVSPTLPLPTPTSTKETPIRNRPKVNRELEEAPTCSSHGKLIEEGLCLCDDGFGGAACEKRTCENCVHGSCKEGVCQCWNGWNGLNCDQLECAIGCRQHGKCEDNGTCSCEKGWNGENCQLQGCPNGCSGKGECVMNGEWTCKCQSGTTGPDCSMNIEMHCDDGLDNDSDGLVDCDDPECCDSPMCSEESMCSVAISPTEVLLRMPPIFNADFAQRVAFLIKDKSVQSYADASQFNASLISVIRGKVVWKGSGADESKVTIALAGVRVSDAAHPLYGFTLTRNDGYFDLVVNGARSINLQFIRTQFQAIKRSVYAPAGQIVHIDDVILQRSTTTGTLPQSPPARAKCSPTMRRIPESVTLTSNWQYTSDGIDANRSMIAVDTRSIVDAIPIAGTDLKLIYDSARSPSAPSTLLIGLLEDQVDVDLRKIHLNIKIAGRRFDYTLSPRINLTHIFTWDKMNAYRQSESGLVPAMVRIGYEYADCERESEIVWISRSALMLGATSRKMIGTMWTVDIHHHLDIVNNIVEMGDGGYRLISESEPRVTTIAGIEGIKRDIDCVDCDGKLDRIALFRPTSLVYAADGSLIVGDHNLIRRIAPDGSVNTILSLFLSDTSHSYYLAVSPFDGSIAISLSLHKQIWKIASLTPHDPRSNYEIIAGDGKVCGSNVGSCGDGGLAQNAQLIYPKGIAYDRNGNLYLADSRRIRVIDTSGHIRSIGGTTEDFQPPLHCPKMVKLADLRLQWPTSLTVDHNSGLVYVLDTSVVYEIDPIRDLSGIVLGAPVACESANSSMNEIRNAKDIAVDLDGSILVVESDGKRSHQIRRLSSDRSTFSLILGGKSMCSCDIASCGCDDPMGEIPASSVHLNSPHGVLITPHGDVLVADSGNAKIKKMTKRMAKYNSKQRTYEVIDSERNEKYIFNRHGLHTSTSSLITGRSLYNFTYNVDSPIAFLSAIQGSSGLTLRVTRHNATNVDLETSSGDHTSLLMSAYDGTLEMVSRRGSAFNMDATKLSYSSRGLLQSKIDVADAILFEYDPMGRAQGLKKAREHWELTKEIVSLGRVLTNVVKNGRVVRRVRIGEGDMGIEENGASTRLMTLWREGFSLSSPYATSSLFDTSTRGGVHTEPVVSRRITKIPAIQDPQRRELTTRWNWRYVAKQSGESRKIAEINGVNMFSMEYDIDNHRDTLKAGSSDDSTNLFHVEYTDAGEIRKIWTPSEEENSIEKLQVSWDSLGRPSEIAWGSWKIQKAYDSLNRLVEISEDGARVPMTLNYTGLSSRPSSIRRDDGTWSVQYDNYERVKEVVSPTGETTTFSAISLGAGQWVFKRRSPINTKPYMIRRDAEDRILEAMSPNGQHHYFVRGEEKIEQVLNDGHTTVVSCWNPEGAPLCSKSKWITENVTLQGHLVARRMITALGKTTVFTYEYDDLQRAVSIQPIIENTLVEGIQITYDDRTGHVSSLNGFTLIRDSTTTRCQGHGMTIETSRMDRHRQIVSRKLIYGDVRATLLISRDSVGRAASSELAVTSDSVRTSHQESRTFDAMGRVASWQLDDEKFGIGYTKDGRVEKLNDRIVEFHRGGSSKAFGDAIYSVDSNGWVTKRKNCTFRYDGKGRLITAKSPIGEDITMFYDLEDRLIAITRKMETILMYYGIPENPRLVSHFSRNGVISTIYYDGQASPFAVIADDGSRWAVLADEVNTMRIVASEARIVKMVSRDMFGAVSDDSNPHVWMPLGYLGGIDIPEVNVTVMKNGRPLDLVTGRYLTISPEAVSRLDFDRIADTMDMFALESPPFEVPRIPISVEEWFELVGMSPTLLPNVNLGLTRLKGPVAHRLLASFPKKLTPLTHIGTVTPSQLLHRTDHVQKQWSIEDIGFSNLLIVNVDEKGYTSVDALPTLEPNEISVAKAIIDGSQLVKFSTWSPVPVVHLWRKTETDNLSSSSFQHFTLVASRENVELRNGKSKIIVHFAKELDEVMKRLTDELRTRESISVWKAERKRLTSGDETWNSWNPREQRELESKGTVSGHTIEMRPAYRDALFATIHSWKFKRA